MASQPKPAHESIVPRTPAPIARPIHRSLQAFAFDPGRGKNYGNYMTLQVPFEEPLEPGPVGRQVAVVDYDSANQCYYEPVDLNHPWILANDGLDPSEADPRFHQQMVYAVVCETIRRFEFALGRPIRWRPDHRRKDSPFQSKLLLFPHAMQDANAFYDPQLHAILFGYFPALETDPGNNLPGQIIFTCLAHDIIAHETTHAVVDGIRSRFIEPTNPDVAAFHEAFADIVALFQHFSIQEALLEALRGTGGLLYRSQMQADVPAGPDGAWATYELTKTNPLVILANQFGDAIGLHAGLRSAIGTRPDSTALANMTEPHDRGSILVAAVFDAFFTIYLRRTRELWRLAGLARSGSVDIDLHPELLAQLARAASITAGQFETLCIRALDYCPPVDITFGDYLRALITADHDLVRDDPLGFRAALIDAFRSRGIRPEGVASYSEESLLWLPPLGTAPRLENIASLVPQDGDDPDDLARRMKILYDFATRHADVFGLDNPEHVSACSFHQIHRVGPDGQLLNEMVGEVVEQRPADDQETVIFGGVTLIFNSDGTVRYAVRKSLRHSGTAEAQTAFRQQLWEQTSGGSYGAYQTARISFQAMHRGF
jgi:hypothetical protein